MNLKFDKSLQDKIKSALDKFMPTTIDDKSKRRAAIAFVLTDCSQPAEIANIEFCENEKDHAAFILTTRAAKLNKHAGQRAYPGGRIDPGESSLDAALRELHEEIGIELCEDDLLGRLDDYATRSGFIISPFVFWAKKSLKFVANPDEVEAIHRIPLNQLLRRDAPILETIPESEHPVLKMPIGDEWFASPSAAIAYQFREVALLGKQTRVAHFEQPYFAWK